MSECLSSTQACDIRNLPDEILVKIISHFDVKEQMVLADSCQRFYDLVFKDAELLRDLDYSKHPNLTLADILRYFDDEERHKHVRRVNVENFDLEYPASEGMLRDLIGQATNLVDINILGQNFSNIKDLDIFLQPLMHVKRLSVNWPDGGINDFCGNVLAERFSKLTYLSVEINFFNPDVFFEAVQFCTELEELRIFDASFKDYDITISWASLSLNKNLRIIDLRGWALIPLRRRLISMLSDPSEWTEIRGLDVFHRQCCSFVKNMKVCEKLRDTVFEVSESGLVSVSNRSLLKAVIKMNHEQTPDEFNCLPDDDACVLKIDEAKRLFTDSGYQISYLNTFVDVDSDAHLIASAFNNITKLVSHRYPYDENSGKLTQSGIRYKRSTDSPFKRFIKYTPNLRELDMSVIGFGCETLSLISHWKKLRILRLGHLEANDARFLIDIGKNCPGLEILNLYKNWYRDLHSMECCTDDLSEMLNNGCRNLKEFTIDDYIPFKNRLFEPLSKNSNLRKIKIVTQFPNDYYPDPVASIKQLIRECPKLDELIFGKISNAIYHEFESAVQRAKVELNRPNFRFVLECFDRWEF